MKSNILEEVFSQTTARPLFHYTTQSGLLGILRNRTMWATHTQYQNDQREFLHAVDLVRDEVTLRRQEENPELVEASMLSLMEATLDSSPEGVNVCVASFSEEPDSLSQWRA